MDHIYNFRKLGISKYAKEKYFDVVNASRGLSQRNLQNLLYKSLGIMVVTLQKVDSILHNMLKLHKQLSMVTVEIDMKVVLEEYIKNKDKLIDDSIDKPNIPNDNMVNYINLVCTNGYISKDQNDILHSYRKLRNTYIHKAFVVEPRKLINTTYIKESISDIAAIAIVLGDFTETLVYNNIENLFGTKEAVDFFKGVQYDAIEKMKK